MPYIPQVDTQIPLSVVNPLDAAAKGFSLGQEQLQAQRQTQQYNQQQEVQRALRDVFSKADTSTKEGRADLVRQASRIDPKTGMELQDRFAKQELEQSQMMASKAKAGYESAEADKLHHEEFFSAAKELAPEYDAAFKEAQSRIKSGELPAKVMAEIGPRLKQQVSNSLGNYSDTNPLIGKVRDTLGSYDNLTLDSLNEKLQGVNRTVQAWQGIQQNKVPSGYRLNSKGELEPIPGGPADPEARAKLAGAESSAKEKGKQSAQAEEYSPKQKELLAELARLNVNLPTGLRSKEQIKATLTGLITKYPDKSATQLAEEIRSGKLELSAQTKEAQIAGGQVGKISMAINEIESFAPQAISALGKLDRTTFLPVNKLMQAKEEQLADPNLRRLRVFTQEILNANDQIGGRGGTDVEKRKEMHQLLMTADSPEAYKAAVNAILEAGKATKSAAKRTINEVSGREDKTEEKPKTVHWDDLK